MITNPYKILGVPDGASEEECARAYKNLAKKYHPDLNPNDALAAEKMAEINAAFDLIKNVNTDSTGYSNYDAGASRRNNANGSTPNYYASAAQFINNRQFSQAINLLNQIDDKTGKWYYLSSVANMGIGNKNKALSHIQQACAIEPNNPVYSSFYAQIRSGIYSQFYEETFDSEFNDFENKGDFKNAAPYNNPNKHGCLYRFIKFFFIIFIIRLIISLILSITTGSYNRRKNYENTQPSTSYSQNYKQGNSTSSYNRYFGENSGEKSEN